MTATNSAALGAAREINSTLLYRRIWKWHFFAALYVLPFMALLSVTGGLYLFSDNIEEVIYKQRLNVEPNGQPVSIEQQVATVSTLDHFKRLRAVHPTPQPHRSTVIEYQDNDNARRLAWINPYTSELIKQQTRDSLLMRKIRKLHGELLLGKTGTLMVELAAHWAIVLLITGVYLWWPRGSRTFASAFSLPSGQGRLWWMQLHRFVGLVAVLVLLPLLISGLPWTEVWGGAFSRVQEMTGQRSPSRVFGGPPVHSSEPAGQTISYAQVISAAEQQGVAGPYEVRPPKDDKRSYFVLNKNDDRRQRVELHIDQYSGAVINRLDFSDYPPMAAISSLGISFHQGELYGWLNVAQNLLAAVLGLTLSVTGFLAWWKRRPAGKLGVPAQPNNSSGNSELTGGVVVLTMALMMFLPLMAVSLVLVVLLDKFLFSRIGWMQGKEG